MWCNLFKYNLPLYALKLIGKYLPASYCILSLNYFKIILANTCNSNFILRVIENKEIVI